MTVMSETRNPSPAPNNDSGEEVTPPTNDPATPPIDLARLVRDHQVEIWRYLRYLGADPPEAEDLTQETFLAVARSTFVEESAAQTAGYLRTVARRQLLMLRRTKRRGIRTVDFDAAESVWAETLWQNPAGKNQFDDHVDAARGCVEQLEGRAKQAIDLSYGASESRDAIAAQLKMKPAGVKTLLRRTRQVLRECIEKKLREVL